MFNNRKITLNTEFGDVVISSDHLEFNEATLSKYLEKEAGWYGYYGQKFADSEYIASTLEAEYEEKYSEAFKVAKSEGATEKLAEAIAKTSQEVLASKQKVLKAKHNVKLLQQHLKAFDKSHENVQNRGNTLRREMDRLNPVIYGSNPSGFSSIDESGVDAIIKPVEQQPLDKLS